MSILTSLALVVAMSSAVQSQEPMDDGPKAPKARWCGECRTFLEAKALVDKHQCPTCHHVARRVETEAVKRFVCDHCGRRTECPRECCGGPVKETSVRAAVVWRCADCGAFEPREGPCPSAGCRKMGRALVRSVELPREDAPGK